MSKFYNNDNKNQLYPDIGQNKQGVNPSSPNRGDPSQADIFDKHNKGMKQSVFLKEAEVPKEKDEGCCNRCCSCLSLDYYKDYFKVTNKTVIERMLLNLKFWSGGFFNDLQADYDFYGPFWLYTTMVFICSAVHNVLVYQNNPNLFAYDFGVIGVSLAIFYIMGLLISAIFGLLFGCLGLNCKTSHIVCLYGYSMTIYIICVLLCIINMTLTTWIFLIYAAATKVAFILKNMFEKLQVPLSRKMIVLILVIAEAAIQLFAIKFALIVSGTGNTSILSHYSVGVSHNAVGEMHLRSHETIF